jgi:hypothetical protein
MTSTAARSVSPPASSFQTSTIAMQRARPTTITPVRYAGWSAKNSHASVNISAGPTTHDRNSETPNMRPSPRMRPMSS